MKGSSYSSPFFTVNTGDIITTFTGVDAFALSLNITRHPNSLDQLKLSELSYETSNIITTAQLTATVEPSNTTDTVAWTVEPTGVVTVKDGLVTALRNGEAVVTATCGTQTATCNVAVSSI